MNRLGFLFLGVLLFGHFASANPVENNRFSQWLIILEKPLSSTGDPNQAVQALLQTPNARIAAFNIQALGRIYADLDKEFKKLRFDFKAIEDGLGTIEKWKTVNNAVEVQKAMASFAKILLNEHWIGSMKSPKIEETRKMLSSVKWPGPGDDQAYVSSELVDQLKYVRKTDFQFATLEEGNGLHEFRREVRWFLIEARVLNGVLKFRSDKSCPVEGLNDLLTEESLAKFAEDGYATLPTDGQTAKPCEISQCYFLDLVRTVDKIGKLKDKSEGKDANLGIDEVSPKTQAKAQAIYDAMIEHDTLTGLIKEIKSCLPDGGKKKKDK